MPVSLIKDSLGFLCTLDFIVHSDVTLHAVLYVFIFVSFICVSFICTFLYSVSCLLVSIDSYCVAFLAY